MKRTLLAVQIFVFLLLSAAIQANSAHDELRLYNKAVYKVLDTYGFVIYSKDVHVTGSKARVMEKKYFFSVNERSEIIPLTKRNLKIVFRDREFHDLLDVHFRASRDLAIYDPYFNEYKLKYIFRKAFSRPAAE
jgi:hypothetical protein